MNLETLVKGGLLSLAGIAVTTGGAAAVVAGAGLLGAATTAMGNTSYNPLTFSTSFPWSNPQPHSQASTSNVGAGRVRREAAPSTAGPKKKTSCQELKKACLSEKRASELKEQSTSKHLTKCLSDNLDLTEDIIEKTSEATRAKVRADTYQNGILALSKTNQGAQNETIALKLEVKTQKETLKLSIAAGETLGDELKTTKASVQSCNDLLTTKEARIDLLEKQVKDLQAGITEKCFLMTPGADGQPGPPGQAGPPGPPGEKGDTGPMGNAGPTGATGANGRDGSQGIQGETGPAGDVGFSGLFMTSLITGSGVGTIFSIFGSVILALKLYASCTGLNKKDIAKYRIEGVRAEALRQETDRVKLMAANQNLNDQISYASKMQELSRQQILKLELSTREAEKITAEAKNDLTLQNLLHLKDKARLESLEGLVEQQNILLGLTMEKMHSRDMKIIKMNPAEKAALELSRTQDELNQKAEAYLRTATCGQLRAFQYSAKALKK